METICPKKIVELNPCNVLKTFFWKLSCKLDNTPTRKGKIFRVKRWTLPCLNRKRQRSNSNGNIDPYAVHVTLRDENRQTDYSNIPAPDRPYDVIDLDGVQRKPKPARESHYLEPIPATGDRQYCEITADGDVQDGASTSFGRRNFFLYDVATEVPKRRATYDKEGEAPPPLPSKATVSEYSEIVGTKRLDEDAVQYSLLVPSPQEPQGSSDTKGSPVFILREPNNNVPAVSAPGHSPYGEIIGTINEDDGALNRFKKVEEKYKEVVKKNPKT